MAITAPHQDTERRNAEAQAWKAYRESLQDLEGRAYEETETTSWDELQRRLRQIDAEAPAGR